MWTLLARAALAGCPDPVPLVTAAEDDLANELVAFREVAGDRWEVGFYEHLVGHVRLVEKETLRPT